jgi:hypothetical protein
MRLGHLQGGASDGIYAGSTPSNRSMFKREKFTIDQSLLWLDEEMARLGRMEEEGAA